MAGVAEDVELPIRVHDLLIGMAGRVDDDALSAARERLAVGDPTGAVEMLTGCLVAGKVVTTPAEQDNLGDLLRQVHSDPELAAGLRVRETWRTQEHRFSTEDGPEHGVGSAVRPVLETLPGIESISCVWRTTPSGAAPCALPQRVVLVELGPEGLPTATSYRVHHALTAAGLPAVVEVLRPGTARTDYHAKALAEAHGVDGHRGGFRDEPSHAPSRPAPANHGRRAGARVAAEPRLSSEPRESDYAEPRGIDTHGYEPDRLPDDRPLARPKPVVKRASVTRIQSPMQQSRTPSGSVQAGSSGSRASASGGPGDDGGDSSAGSSALAAPPGSTSRTDSAGKVQPATADREPAPVTLKPSATPTETHSTGEAAVEPSHPEPSHVERPSERPSVDRPSLDRSTAERSQSERSHGERPSVERSHVEQRSGSSRAAESSSARLRPVASRSAEPVADAARSDVDEVPASASRHVTEVESKHGGEPVAARSLAAVPDEPVSVEDRARESAPASVAETAAASSESAGRTAERSDPSQSSVERAPVERKNVERQSVERTSADHSAVERTSGERASGERAAERPVAERAAAERPVVERPAERPVVERQSVERPSVERADVERSGGERASGERAAGERAAGQRAAAAAPKPVRTGRDKPSRLLPGENPRAASRPNNGSAPESRDPASGYFANPELAGIGPADAVAEARQGHPADHHAEHHADQRTEHAAGAAAEAKPGTPQSAQPAASADSGPKRRIPEMPASVAKNLNDKERDLLRQLHEELAQREQQERQDSKKWQLARPSPNREQAAAGSNGAWSPVPSTEETLVNGIPPIKP